MDETIVIGSSIEEHNGLVQRIKESGEFKVPDPNKVTGFRVGHIDIINPKPNHPTSCNRTYKNMDEYLDCPLPVGYAHYGVFYLVNTDKPALREYHHKLKGIITGEQ